MLEIANSLPGSSHVPARGEAHVQAILRVVAVFGADADHFVFVGGCVLGLYARSIGAPLRVTTDVDCISTVKPWIVQEHRLAELCTRGVLVPDPSIQCRYRIVGTEIDMDIMSPDGFNVGGVNPWFRRAAERAAEYRFGPVVVRAVTPPY